MERIKLQYPKDSIIKYVESAKFRGDYDDPMYDGLSMDELIITEVRNMTTLQVAKKKKILTSSTVKLQDDIYIVEGIVQSLPPSRLDSMIELYEAYVKGNDYHGAKAFRQNIVNELNLSPLPYRVE